MDELIKYPPLSEQDSAFGFCVTSYGKISMTSNVAKLKADHPALYTSEFFEKRGRALPEFLVAFFCGGSGDIFCEGKKMRISGDSVIFIPPDMRHRYMPHKSWTAYWFNFSGALAHAAFDKIFAETGGCPHAIAPASGFAARFEETLSKLDAQEPPLCKLSAVSGLVGDFLKLRAGLKKNQNPRKGLAEAALDYIWKDPRGRLRVADVAAQFCVSAKTLERAFAAKFSTGVRAQILKCRLMRAEGLLKECDLPLKTVAALSGFSSYANLRNAFAKKTALPASGRRRP